MPVCCVQAVQCSRLRRRHDFHRHLESLVAGRPKSTPTLWPCVTIPAPLTESTTVRE